MMTAGSALVPLVGLATAPILAQALGVQGRGEVAVVVAPNVLLVGVATLGLPEALTFHLAKRPDATRRALLIAASATTLASALGVIFVFLSASALTGGDEDLVDLVLLGGVLAVPTMWTSVLRGAASGRQMWTEVTMERIVTSVLRLMLLAGLALTGHLDVLAAVLVTLVSPIVSGAVYWRLALPRPEPAQGRSSPDPPAVRADHLLSYGSRIWLGSIATIVLARLAPLVTAPLSDLRQLGLLVVAITIADVPFIVVQTIRDVLFGIDSAQDDPARLATVCRVTTAAAFIGSAVVAATLPWWLGPLFGESFAAAVVPTWVMLASTVAVVPGVIVGAGLAAAGRPASRSAALSASLVVNALGLLLLVPRWGATGAAIAAVVASAVASAWGVVALARSHEARWRWYILPTRADLRLVADLSGRVVPSRWRP